MSCKKVASGGAIVGLLLFTCLFASERSFAQGDSQGQSNQIAGSYLATAETFLGPLQVLLTINPGGGYTLVTNASAGLGGQTPWASRSPTHGTWERTGSRQITATDLRFDYDADGNHISTPVVTRIITFDHDFDSFTGSETFKVFSPDQDPLDPNSIPFAAGAGQFYGRRIPSSIE